MDGLSSHDETLANPLKLSPVKFGMWLFLASEVMFFTGLLGSFVVLRIANPEKFHEQAAELNWPLAALNTLVLITSSFTMALAVARTQRKTSGTNAEENSRAASPYLLATMLLAFLFLGIKAVEYATKFKHGIFPATSIFFASYFTLTGCHALHVIAGIFPMLRLWLRSRRGALKDETAELMGLYWHFVDLVWIFLFPLLYLL